MSTRTTAPYQSFLNARVRSIETGIPQVRSTNSGISAIIDSKGRILDYMSADKKGSLESALPFPDEETIYSRLGDAPFLILITLIMFVGFIWLILKKFEKSTFE